MEFLEDNDPLMLNA